LQSCVHLFNRESLIELDFLAMKHLESNFFRSAGRSQLKHPLCVYMILTLLFGTAQTTFGKLGIFWATQNGGILTWDGSVAPDDGLDGGEIWQLILTLDGIIHPVDPANPLVPSSDQEMILDQVTGTGPTISKTGAYTAGINGEVFPETGTFSVYIRVINLAPENAPTHAFSYYDRGSEGIVPVNDISGYPADASPPPPPRSIDILSGRSIVHMVLVRTPVAIGQHAAASDVPGAIDLRWNSEIGTTYTLQYSTDYLSWNDLPEASNIVASTAETLRRVQRPEPFFVVRIRRHD
jgi:hypothetical protein